MKKGKKFLLALLALLSASMLVSFAACGEPETPGPDNPPIVNPDPEKPDPENPDPEKPDPEKPEEDPLAGVETLTEVPESTMKIQAVASGRTATSNWFVEYSETTLDVTVYVKDATVYTNSSSVFNNDGIEVIVTKVQRLKGYSTGTISVSVDAKGEYSVINMASRETVEDSGITASAKRFTIAGEAVEGYYINLSIPYAATEITAADKDAALALGLVNANSAVTINTRYSTDFGADYENVHTYAALTADNTFAANPYVQYGMTWGKATSALRASSVWNTENDDGTENAYIYSDGVDGQDNYIYMHKSNAQKMYAEFQINARQLYNGELWGKFGLTVTSADGGKGFFFYVDASAANGVNFDTNAINVGYNTRADVGAGKWNGSWAVIGNLGAGATSAAYTGDNYITMGVFRDGSTFNLYLNGKLIKTVSSDIAAGDDAYVGIASFNISMNVKNYKVVTDENELGEYEIVREDVNNLFFGDSYVDKAFWYTFDTDFGSLAGIKSVNVGVGGTKVGYWIDMVQSLKALYNVDNLIVHIGVNDIDGGTSGEATITLLETMFDVYHTAFPEANIYYLGLVDNMMFPGKWTEYHKVNAWIEDAVDTDEYSYLNYIDMAEYITMDERGSTQSWFIADGLHYGVDGYGVWTREIKRALGIDRTTTAGGLGDLNVDTAPAFTYSAGWTVSDGVWHNAGFAEQQLFIDGAYGADVYAEAKVSVAGTTTNDNYPKAGLAIRSASKGTWFYFLDAFKDGNGGGTLYRNNWGNVVYRPEKIGRDWDWACELDQYQYTYGTSYDYKTDASFKALAVAKVGADLYFLADGKVVDSLIGVLGANDQVAVSVFTFNLDMYAKEGVAVTEASELAEKLASFKIYKNTDGLVVDGNISDWTAAMKTNPYEIPAKDGKSVTVYATKASNGIYIFYDVVHASYRVDSNNWFENTNVEFRLADGGQRFASAKGQTSRWEDNGQRQISAAAFTYEIVDNKYHTKAEIFVSYSVIDSIDVTSEYVLAGFAWKTGGENGSAWAAGDFWYGPEADPGFRTIQITNNGIKTGTVYTIDGDLTDWNGVDFTAANVAEGVEAENDVGVVVTASYAAQLRADGVYLALKIQAPDINVMNTKAEGDWWLNTNFEFFATNQDEGRVSDMFHTRLMTFGGKLYHCGGVTDAAMNYVAGDTDTLTIEVFIAFGVHPNITADDTSVALNLAGRLYGEGINDTFNQYTGNITVSKA